MKRVEECIVLAGGKGTRLRSVVSDVPKPLAPVAGRPFIAWLLDRLATQGIRHVILATGYLAEQVEAAVGRRWKGMSISFSCEYEPLGTGGAIRAACNQLNGPSCHVVNGDTYVEYSISSLESTVKELKTSIGMVLAPVDNVSRYGSVLVSSGRAVGFSEKGRNGHGLINAGCYFLTADAINMLPDVSNFSFEQDVLLPASVNSDIAVISDARKFIDIGIPEDFERAQSLFKNS